MNQYKNKQEQSWLPFFGPFSFLLIFLIPSVFRRQGKLRTGMTLANELLVYIVRPSSQVQQSCARHWRRKHCQRGRQRLECSQIITNKWLVYCDSKASGASHAPTSKALASTRTLWHLLRFPAPTAGSHFPTHLTTQVFSFPIFSTLPIGKIAQQ